MKKHFLFLFVCLCIVYTVAAKTYVATQDIKVRDGKGNKYQELGVIKKGTKLDIADTNSTWREIKNGDGDETGYINDEYLDEVADETQTAATVNMDSNSVMNIISDWVNRHTIATLLGAVILLLILRKVTQTISDRRNGPNADQYEARQHSLVKFWYHCKHCAALVKKDTEPNSHGCAKSLNHKWTQLAEVGQHKYICKNCSVSIHAKMDPSDHGCPESTLHRWIKK
jgi:hypothetical protein